jgi:hypothetical protein
MWPLPFGWRSRASWKQDSFEFVPREWDLLDTGNSGTALSTRDGCWAAIIAFYAALHLADRLGAAANLQLHPTPPGAHGTRLRFLYANHRAIHAAYNDLKTTSEIARYGTLNQFNRAFPGTTVQELLTNQKLVVIETYVNNFFNPPAPSPPPVTTGS